MHTHGTAVLTGLAEATPVALTGGSVRQMRLPARNAHLPSIPAQQTYPEPDSCPDCCGAGYIPDDGSVTDMIGWPIPCYCAEYIPRNIKALFSVRPTRSALLPDPLSRIKL
jgi:hypothetical protein